MTRLMNATDLLPKYPNRKRIESTPLPTQLPGTSIKWFHLFWQKVPGTTSFVLFIEL